MGTAYRTTGGCERPTDSGSVIILHDSGFNADTFFVSELLA